MKIFKSDYQPSIFDGWYFFYVKWGAIMYCEFVYVGYQSKQCVEFLNGIEEKLKAHDKDFEYNRKNLLIICKSFKIRALPIYSGNLGCHGMENAQYICKETARPERFYSESRRVFEYKRYFGLYSNGNQNNSNRKVGKGTGRAD